MAKEQLEFLQVDLVDAIQPAARRKQAIGHDCMQMRVKIDHIAEGLNRHDHAGDRLILAQGGLKEGFHTGIDTLAEFAQ